MEVLIAVTLLSLLDAGHDVRDAPGADGFREDGQQADGEPPRGGSAAAAGAGTAGADSGGGAVRGRRPGPEVRVLPGRTDQIMRWSRTFSLQEAWRGQPQILELFVIPGENGEGVRLVVNEIPYTGPVGAGTAVPGLRADPQTGVTFPALPAA